jgi:hypothetical protein
LAQLIPTEEVGVIEDPNQQREWVRQQKIVYAGLLGAAFIMVEPFLTAASLDVSGKICVVAFAVAIPLLAGLLLVAEHEAFVRHPTKSVLVKTTKPVAQNTAFVAIVAGFWHISWIAGIAMIAATVVAVGVHSAGYSRMWR